VSDYVLDDRVIGVRSPAGAKDFSFILCVQTGSGVHPASCPTGTGVLSLGVKRGRGVNLAIHPHLVPRSWMSRSYTSSPPSASMACSGTALLFIYIQRESVCVCLRSMQWQYNYYRMDFIKQLRDFSSVNFPRLITFYSTELQYQSDRGLNTDPYKSLATVQIVQFLHG
jgi:hypothetical protein